MKYRTLFGSLTGLVVGVFFAVLAAQAPEQPVAEALSVLGLGLFIGYGVIGSLELNDRLDQTGYAYFIRRAGRPVRV